MADYSNMKYNDEKSHAVILLLASTYCFGGVSPSLCVSVCQKEIN